MGAPERAGWEEREAWKRAARCLGANLKHFFPERGDRWAPGKKLCADCPVQRQCLEWGLRFELDGIWGGMTREERVVERRRRNIILDSVGGEPINPFR